MSALPKSALPTPPRSVVVNSPTPLVTKGNDTLPTSLKVLLRFQQVTSGITLGVMATVLGIYGWTVYTPVLWSKQYQELKALQQTERQLITNTEAIKHQLAQEADRPSSGLVNPSPSQNIFLPAKQPQQSGKTDSTTVAVARPLSITTGPVAY